MNRLTGALLAAGLTLAVILLISSSSSSSSDSSSSAKRRVRRAAYQLPDGIEFLVDPIRTTFECPGDGYYADMDNNCQLFHVCHSYEFPDGRVEMQHHSFACGNQTVFNQLSMTCSYEEDAIPCPSSGEFFYLNQVLGLATEPFLTDTDLQRADEFFGRRTARTAPVATRSVSAGAGDDDDEPPSENSSAALRRPLSSSAAAGPSNTPRAARAAALRETTTTRASPTTTTTPAPTTTSAPATTRQPLNARIVIANTAGARRSGKQKRQGKDRRLAAASAVAPQTMSPFVSAAIASPLSPSGPMSLSAPLSPASIAGLAPGTQIFITRLKGAAKK